MWHLGGQAEADGIVNASFIVKKAWSKSFMYRPVSVAVISVFLPF